MAGSWILSGRALQRNVQISSFCKHYLQTENCGGSWFCCNMRMALRQTRQDKGTTEEVPWDRGDAPWCSLRQLPLFTPSLTLMALDKQNSCPVWEYCGSVPLSPCSIPMAPEVLFAQSVHYVWKDGALELLTSCSSSNSISSQFMSVKRQTLSHNPKMVGTSSSQKLCNSDEKRQLMSYNCVLGKTGNKAAPSPYSGSHKSQTSFFPHSTQSLDLEGKSIHPINKVC